jgi:hypothetical protein
MWWAGSVAKPAQAIQDRWRAAMHLIREQPTQMAIPLQKEFIPESVGRCNVACCFGIKPDNTF